jgi:SAM-dependent methyltransferase
MMVEEVHLWRGTPAERALRAQLIKSTQFGYFDEQLDHPDWSDKLVLDFGGNRGNLLHDPACVIPHRNYYCLDVISEAIDEGRKAFPAAHWGHYNRYNRSFNPEGIPALPVPDPGVRFDVILAYSVFTHTTFEEMKDLVRQLETRLAPGGTLAFTFIDPHWRPVFDPAHGSTLQWRLEKKSHAIDLEAALAESRDAEWCSLVNGTELYLNSSGPWTADSQACATYNVFYTEAFLQKQFPRATIRPPVKGEMQHCAILRKSV